MNILKGIKDTTIIDDSYNSSSEAVKAALDTVYRLDGFKHKIVVLGNMNEMGNVSELLHREVGDYCRPDQIDEVITIGKDANKFLAEAARKAGCAVKTFSNPLEIGKYLKDELKTGSLLLVKGSQNGVFAEETVKLLLADKSDEKYLVRQSPEWLNKKARSFKHA